jgi:hypothetical protein
MKILSIKRLEKTESEDYTLITFKNWWGTKFTEICITPNWNLNTDYAKNGKNIEVSLWKTVKAFLRTNQIYHEYEY